MAGLAIAAFIVAVTYLASVDWIHQGGPDSPET